MKAVVDRVVQYANRYQLTNVETGEVLGIFDFEEVTGTVQQVGTEIDKELFDSIANDLAARVKLSGGELAGTIVTFSDISGTAANVASGDTSATLWGKVKNWFSRLKALAFKNKVAVGDFEAGAIKNADVAADAAIAQSKVSGLMTDYVASISVSGRTVTYKNKNGVNMGSITTQDTTYGLASQSSNGLMSSTDKTKLDGIESGAQKNTVLGVKGSNESAYRTGNVNIMKANIGLGNVDNTSDEDKPVSTATQTALNDKANTSGTYPNLTVGKATNADNATNATKATQDASGNVIASTYATKNELTSGLSGKANTSGSYPNLTVGKATNADNASGAEYLSRFAYLFAGASQTGWWKLGSIKSDGMGVSQNRSCVFLVNGVLSNQGLSTAGETGFLEFDVRKESAITDAKLSVLGGNLNADEFCVVLSQTEATVYIKLPSQYNAFAVTMFSEDGGSASKASPLFEFDTQFIGSSTPSGAQYAVVRNNASRAEATLIPNGIDVNTYRGNNYWGKTYYAGGSNTVQNIPVSGAEFILEVLRSGSASTVQRITTMAAGSNNQPTMYTRSVVDSTTAADGTWTAWTEVAEANGTYPNMTVGKATDSDKLGGKPASDYALKSEVPGEIKLYRHIVEFNGYEGTTYSFKAIAVITNKTATPLVLNDIITLFNGVDYPCSGYISTNEPKEIKPLISLFGVSDKENKFTAFYITDGSGGVTTRYTVSIKGSIRDTVQKI